MANTEPTNTSSEKGAISPAGSTRLFFIARYGGRLVAIRKNTDFSATLASIQKAFPQLRSLKVSEIHLLSQLDGCGDDLIEITDELWADLSPDLKYVQIDVLSETELQQDVQRPKQYLLPDKHPRHPAQNFNSERIIVHVQDPAGHLKDLYLPLFTTSTVRDLKDLIVRHDNRLPQQLALNFEGYSNLEDHKRLRDYGINNESTVDLVTAFQVYLTTSRISGSSVTIPIFAAVSAIKILACDLFDLHPLRQTLSCDGEALADEARVGSYSQFLPGCTIFINETPAHSFEDLATIIVRKESSTNGAAIQHSCMIFRTSKVLDLKVLIFNQFDVPVFRQKLIEQGLPEDKMLQDCQTIAGSGLRSGDKVVLTSL